MTGKSHEESTVKALKMLEFMKQYYAERGFPPSRREIADFLHNSSTSVVNFYLNKLEKLQEIELTPATSRGIKFKDSRIRLPLYTCPLHPCATISLEPGRCKVHKQTLENIHTVIVEE